MLKRSENSILKETKKAWVVAVDMGYGHQRAAYPLRYIAYRGDVINANNYPGIPASDRKIWHNSRVFYEFISRFKKVPLIGKAAFDLYDRLQEIPRFYPKRDWSEPNIALNQMYRIIKEKNWGHHLISKLSKRPLPLISTFFATAFMAEVFDYPEEIYCLATDTDISRSWVPPKPRASRIKYFAPTLRVQERLKQYGVRPENIFLTGFPLPKKNVGGYSLPILKQDLANRMCNLDPHRNYITRYADTIKRNLGSTTCPVRSNHPLTLMFAVGGAGAQRDIGVQIVQSLARKIMRRKIRIILVAGIHNDVATYFKKEIERLGLGALIGTWIKIIHAPSKNDYFRKFEQALRTTDIVWTKPSELSFYTALGLPIIMSYPIGSQEKFNRTWLLTIGSGIDAENPDYTDEWLFDWIESGWFAEAAMQGFMEAPRAGTYNIAKIVAHKPEEMEDIRSYLQY